MKLWVLLESTKINKGCFSTLPVTFPFESCYPFQGIKRQVWVMSYLFYFNHPFPFTTLSILFNNTQGVQPFVMAPMARNKFFVTPETKTLSPSLI
jgi:hypothetical protein